MCTIKSSKICVTPHNPPEIRPDIARVSFDIPKGISISSQGFTHIRFPQKSNGRQKYQDCWRVLSCPQPLNNPTNTKLIYGQVLLFRRTTRVQCKILPEETVICVWGSCDGRLSALQIAAGRPCWPWSSCSSQAQSKVGKERQLPHDGIPDICHERHEYIRVNFFWPVSIFTDLTRKIGFFDRFYAKKWRFFTDLTRKIGVFRCKFYSPKILPV